MSFGRFLLATSCGAVGAFWALFLVSIFLGDGEGQIHWTGTISGEFLPWYLAALYVPPLIAMITGFLALRRPKVTNAAD